jgi:hypothetical protein
VKPGLRHLKKTLIGVINHFRILRAHNPSVLSCTGFAFPKKAKKACVAKITVTFVDFTIIYRIEYLTRKEVVAGAITQVLMDRWLQNPIPSAADNDFLYFLRLSQQDCDTLQLNLEQVTSRSSILLRTRDKAKYFKNHIEKHTEHFCVFASRNMTTGRAELGFNVSNLVARLGGLGLLA